MTEEEELAFQNILDCFSGADGGGNFVSFKSFMSHYSRQAQEGDENAKQLLNIMLQFNRMIELSITAR